MLCMEEFEDHYPQQRWSQRVIYLRCDITLGTITENIWKKWTFLLCVLVHEPECFKT